MFWQGEGGIGCLSVTGVQTCALPISVRRDELPVPREDLGGTLERPQRRSGEDRGERAESEREARDDTEVAAAATQPPEEVRVLLFARGDEAAVRKDNVRLDEIVDRKPELAGHVTDTAAERETADAGCRDDPERCGERERLRGVVDLA